MTSKSKKWTKTELQIYILLLCANADKEETEEELEMIKSKVSKETFDKIYQEFSRHSDKKRLKKVDRNIHEHIYSDLELSAFRKEIFAIFMVDNNFKMMEKRLDWTLDNILY
jgi:hypothetical protein